MSKIDLKKLKAGQRVRFHDGQIGTIKTIDFDPKTLNVWIRHDKSPNICLYALDGTELCTNDPHNIVDIFR